MTAASLMATIVPIFFVVALGLLAGRTGAMKPSDSKVLSDLALTFCLPALLFDAIARTKLEELADWRLLAGIALGLAIPYGLLLAYSRYGRRSVLDVATMQAANGAAPEMGAIGVPLMLAILGKPAVIALILGNLVISFCLLPLTLVLLALGRSGGQRKPLGTLVLRAVLGALRSPLVWAPLAGLAVLLLDLPYPAIAHKSFTLIGDPMTGILLFAIGLFLSGQRFSIGRDVIVNTAVKLLLQPATMWAAALLFSVTPAGRGQMILLGAMPTATVLALFAMDFGIYAEETDATIVLSTAVSLVTIFCLTPLLR